MNTKQLKLLKLAAAVICTILVVFLLVTFSKSHKKEEEFIVGEIRNNNSTIIAYGDEIFFLNNTYDDNTISFKLSNRNEKEGKNIVIKDFKRVYAENPMIAANNKIFFSDHENTYYYDIETKKIVQFAQGTVQYLSDGWYVTLYNDTLYKGEYYPKTFNTKNISQLTKNGDVKRCFEDDEMIYYIAYSERSYRSLIGLKKSDLSISVFDTTEGSTEKILTASSNKEYIFEIMQKDEKTFLRTLERKDKNKKENLELENLTNITFIPRKYILEQKEYDENIYFIATNKAGDNEFYTYNISKKELKKEKPEQTDVSIYNYSTSLTGNSTFDIFKNGMSMATINIPNQTFATSEIAEINKVDNDLYFRVTLDKTNNRSCLVKISEDGKAELYQ